MSPLKILVKSYSDELISKEEYIHIRTLLLNKLEKNGVISENDLENFLNLKEISSANAPPSRYHFSDLIIIFLGLSAIIALAYILYF